MNLSNLNIDIINKGTSKKEICEVEQEMDCNLPVCGIYKFTSTGEWIFN